MALSGNDVPLGGLAIHVAALVREDVNPPDGWFASCVEYGLGL